jgi:hypothetical protein
VSPERRISFWFGVLYLITFATSIGALLLFQPVLDDPQGYIAGAGADNRIYFGALLELILIIANIGTAIVIFPIVKRMPPHSAGWPNRSPRSRTGRSSSGPASLSASGTGSSSAT